MKDEVQVATSGSIARDDRCVSCEGPMLYVVDDAGSVKESMCGNADCACFLVGIPDEPLAPAVPGPAGPKGE